MGKPEERLGDSLDGFDPDPEPAARSRRTSPTRSPARTGCSARRPPGCSTTSTPTGAPATSRSRSPPGWRCSPARRTSATSRRASRRRSSARSATPTASAGRSSTRARPRPGPVADGGPDVEHRWIGSGWTVFNNKGLPVRSYEPFFTATPGFEFARAQSASARSCSTTRSAASWPPCIPDDSYDKTVFDPWHTDTWDVNDTVLLDPREDPDVAGYAGRYLAVLGEQPGGWATWYAQRIGGAPRPGRSSAPPSRRVPHAGTPARAWLDTLGRTFLTVAHNRVPAATGAWPTSSAGPAACWTSRATSTRCGTRSAARSCATATRCSPRR